MLPAGVHQLSLSGSDLPPGMYFLSLQIAGRRMTRKVVHW